MSDQRGISSDSWRKILAECDGLSLRVTSTSMKPTLLPGDQVFVVSALLEDLQPGDVGVYERNGELICHRLLRTGEFRGDNCLDTDLPIEASDIVGRVTRIERDGTVVDDAVWRRLGNRLRFLLHAQVLHRYRGREGAR